MPVKRPTRTHLLHIAGATPQHEVARLREWVAEVNHVATHTAAEQHRLTAEFTQLQDDLADAANVGRSVAQLGRRLVREHAEMVTEIAELRTVLAQLAMVIAERNPELDLDPVLDVAVEPTVVPEHDVQPGVERVQLGRGDAWGAGALRLDVRDSAGTELVVRADRLPLPVGSLAELAVHDTVALHEPARVTTELLPYWTSLLRPGGRLVVTCADLDGTLDDWRHGSVSYDDVRRAAIGSNPQRPARSAWSADDLRAAFEGAGLDEVTAESAIDGNGRRRLVAAGRARADA